MSQHTISAPKFVAALMAAASAVALFASPAVAQAPPESGLDVVIITANQREEDLQDVAISAAALPTDQIEALFSGGEDVLAIAARVPGVYGESSNGRVAPRFYIRGLGNTDFDLAASQPVSIIMDDVVMENVVLKSTPLFDLDRVEVYRGPQGTLFGRNTTAGIIRFTSAKPTEEFDARAQASFGSFGTVTFDGAVGGQIAPGVSARGSVLVQHRDNWIDNTFVATDDDELGGFDEVAGRAQLLFTPSDDLDILLNIHGRQLDGTSAIFRANVITPGTNGLNANYDRDRVTFNQGGGNPQHYEGWGASANVGWDIGELTLTSITGYETTNGSSRGDIDGGVAGVGPGFIPFDSDTRDGLDDLEQFTQEVRIAGDTGGRLVWQAGAYYFNSYFNITTVGPLGFPPSTTVTHENTSWALFGQASYDITDAFSVTGGLRYTDDDKDFAVAGAPANNRTVSDDHVSWDVSAMYDITPDFSIYGRVADGFRGPSIQGRDVAFFNPPSVAQSETVTSFEVGAKSSLLDNTLRLNGAVYTYEVNDIQLTAVGGGGNLVQLVNADKGKATGLEVDAEWQPIENLVFTGGFAWTDTELDDPGLAVGICAQCTVTDPIVVINATNRALVDGNPFPNAPEMTADFTARWSVPLGDDAEFFAFTDWAYQGETNLFIYESTEFQTDDQFEGGLKFGWAKTDGSLEVAAFARNITDEDNIKGGIDFNNNTAFVNEPRIIGVSVKITN
ncbi:MAG: TonB-dependent receptor [Hyphomonadaceae bacterium]|nr:TonB-dependent receptor [Hyphomonadaceae bacterium]